MNTTTKIAVGLIALASLTSSASAATITVLPDFCNNEEKGCFSIVIEGEISPVDGGKFLEEVRKNNVKKAAVILNSPGGNLTAAMQIGRGIKAYNFATFVPGKMVCASACAMIWLAGAKLQVETTSRVGFHAAFIVKKQGKQAYAYESGMGNALVGAYYTELGLSQDAIMYFTVAPPAQMLWLKADDATKLGLKIVILDSKVQKDETTAQKN